MVLQKAGRSSGLRLDTSVFGPHELTTTSSSTQLAPALSRSVRRLGHDCLLSDRWASGRIPERTGSNQLEASRWLIDGELSMLDQIAHSGGS